MLASPDLQRVQRPAKTSRTSSSVGTSIGTFDYDAVRREIEESRALKEDADSLVERYLAESKVILARTQEAGARESYSPENKILEVDDASFNTRSKPRTAQRRVAGARKAASRIARSKVIIEKAKKTSTARESPPRKAVRRNAARSPGSANQTFISKQSSIRPVELDSIRTVPKPEVKVIQRSRSQRRKEAPTEVFDRRARADASKFVLVQAGDQTARAAAGRERERERLLGLSSVAQRLTILAESDVPPAAYQGWGQPRSLGPPAGPSPRFLRPEPMSKSESPSATILPHAQASTLQPQVTKGSPGMVPAVQQQEQQQPPLAESTTGADTVPPLEQSEMSSKPTDMRPPLPSGQTLTLPQAAAVAEASPPGPTPALPTSLLTQMHTATAAEEMVRLLQAKASVLETTNEAMRSQMLTAESRALEVERREREEREKRQKIVEEARLAMEEAERTKKCYEDALREKEEALSVISALKEANTQLKDGFDVLKDQVVANQERADRADLTSVRLREEKFQRELAGTHIQKTVALAQVSSHSFDDLCELLVTELLLDNLEGDSSPAQARASPSARPVATILRASQEEGGRGSAYARIEVANEVEKTDDSEDGYDDDFDDEDVEDAGEQLDEMLETMVSHNVEVESVSEVNEDEAVVEDVPSEERLEPSEEPVHNGKPNTPQTVIPAPPIQIDQSAYASEAFVKRMQDEISKIRQEMRVSHTHEREAHVERTRREALEEKVQMLSERETLNKRLVETEAKLWHEEKGQAQLKQLHQAMQSQASLQLKLVNEQRRRQELEADLMCKVKEAEDAKSQLLKEAERADTFALAATSALAREPIQAPTSPVGPPGSKKLEAVATTAGSNGMESEITVVPDERNVGKSDAKEEPHTAPMQYNADVGVPPRAYTIMYARPFDPQLAGDEEDEEEADRSGNSHFNSLLSDYSLGMSGREDLSSDDINASSGIASSNSLDESEGNFDDSTANMLSVAKIRAQAGWGDSGGVADSMDYGNLFGSVSGSVLVDVLDEVVL